MRISFTLHPTGHLTLPGTTCNTDGMFSSPGLGSSFTATPTTLMFYNMGLGYGLVYTKQ